MKMTQFIYIHMPIIRPNVTAGELISSWANGRHFADDMFRCIFVNEKFGILIKTPLKFVPKGLIDNNLALV